MIAKKCPSRKHDLTMGAGLLDMRTRFNPKAETVYFRTFEAREAAFNQAVGSLIPIKYRGPQRFWEDFRRLTSEQRLAPEHLPAFITSNPRDCLAFGSTAQVLAAARLVARRGDNGNPLSVEDVADAFGLSQALTQPIRTLSGGETVRLALAKTVLAAGGSERLVIGSPFCWMSHNHVPLLDRVVGPLRGRRQNRHPAGHGRGGQPFAHGTGLGGERRVQRAGFYNSPWKGVRIRLGTPINALTARPVFAGVDDYCAKMTSPCLVVGDNGQGKSLLAKALSGAAGHSGTARMEAAGTRGRARLLFQDVITQTLLRSLADINRSASRTAPYKPDEIEKAIFLRFCDLLREVGSEQTTWEQDGAQTLLAVKAALIAVPPGGTSGRPFPGRAGLGTVPHGCHRLCAGGCRRQPWFGCAGVDYLPQTVVAAGGRVGPDNQQTTRKKA